MTCSISAELEKRLQVEAIERKTSVDEIVEQAIVLFLNVPKQGSSKTDNAERLRNFEALQKSLALTDEKAAQWKRDIFESRR